MAALLDFLTRPVDLRVRAKGCVSVIPVELAEGGANGARHWGQGARTQDWSLIDTGAIAWRCCSYALVDELPTFVMGGGWVSIGSIERSHDAQSWASVYSQSNFGEGGGVVNMVWDGEQFHAMEVGLRREDTWWEGYILSSSNGAGWSTTHEFVANIESEFEDKRNEMVTAFTDLCPRGLPDGYYGYDADKDILMQPASYAITEDGVQIFSNELQIIGPDDTATVAFSNFVRGVSFAGGVWSVVTEESTPGVLSQAVSIWASVDDGATWSEVYNTTAWVVAGIASGRESDFE